MHRSCCPSGSRSQTVSIVHTENRSINATSPGRTPSPKRTRSIAAAATASNGTLQALG